MLALCLDQHLLHNFAVVPFLREFPQTGHLVPKFLDDLHLLQALAPLWLAPGPWQTAQVPAHPLQQEIVFNDIIIVI